MRAVLDSTSPKSPSLSVRNMRNSARRGLQKLVPQLTGEGNDSEATASILGLPLADIEAVKTHNRIG